MGTEIQVEALTLMRKDGRYETACNLLRPKETTRAMVLAAAELGAARVGVSILDKYTTSLTEEEAVQATTLMLSNKDSSVETWNVHAWCDCANPLVVETGYNIASMTLLIYRYFDISIGLTSVRACRCHWVELKNKMDSHSVLWCFSSIRRCPYWGNGNWDDSLACDNNGNLAWAMLLNWYLWTAVFVLRVQTAC